MIYKGGCHCGAVKFELEAAAITEVFECNCSICFKSGYQHLIIPKTAFHLVSGKDNLNEYTFNSGIAKHLFCRICGVKSFYIPRSNPDGISVNVRCLEPQPDSFEIVSFDGLNWELHADRLRYLSRES